MSENKETAQPNAETHAWVSKEDLQKLVNQRNEAGFAANQAHKLIDSFRAVFEYFGALMPTGAKSMADINPMDLMETINKPIPPETTHHIAIVQQFMANAKAADEAAAKQLADGGKVVPLNPGK